MLECICELRNEFFFYEWEKLFFSFGFSNMDFLYFSKIFSSHFVWCDNVYFNLCLYEQLKLLLQIKLDEFEKKFHD